MTRDDPAYRAAVEAGYADLRGYVEANEPVAVEINRDVFEEFEKIANNPKAPCSVKTAINAALNEWLLRV
jgi:hypothetical protein